jgi:hypothetical protein
MLFSGAKMVEMKSFCTGKKLKRPTPVFAATLAQIPDSAGNSM